jgi:hypothetical protein
MLASSNRLINVAGPELRNTGKGGTTFGGEFATPADEVAGAFEAAAREVAGFAVEACCSYDTRVTCQNPGFVHPEDGGRYGFGRLATADRFPCLPSRWPPVAVLPAIPSAADLALWLGTPGDLDGVVVYMDPPYQATTGYLHSLSRADVVRHALDFDALGAHVAVSEACELPELMSAGWHGADITGGRKGQKRTFSKQQGEYLTMNRPGRYVVAQQIGLFAVSA